MPYKVQAPIARPVGISHSSTGPSPAWRLWVSPLRTRSALKCPGDDPGGYDGPHWSSSSWGGADTSDP